MSSLSIIFQDVRGKEIVILIIKNGLGFSLYFLSEFFSFSVRGFGRMSQDISQEEILGKIY